VANPPPPPSLLPVSATTSTSKNELNSLISALNNKDDANVISGTRGTFYIPGAGGINGGRKDRYGERVVDIHEASTRGIPMTIATQHRGLGSTFNKKNSRGLPGVAGVFLVHYPGLWSKVPSLKKYSDILPPDTMVAVSSDTGGGLRSFRSKGDGGLTGGQVDIPIVPSNAPQGHGSFRGQATTKNGVTLTHLFNIGSQTDNPYEFREKSISDILEIAKKTKSLQGITANKASI
jgi:hypothetical protein